MQFAGAEPDRLGLEHEVNLAGDDHEQIDRVRAVHAGAT